MKRVARRQNAYVLVSAGENEPVGVGDGAGPDCGLGLDGRSQGEVTRAADHEVGAVEGSDCRRRQPGDGRPRRFRRSTAMDFRPLDMGARLVDKAHMRVLILGGTADAMVLGERLAEQAGIAVILSLAGRTQQPRAASVPMRIGGFGGLEGLKAWLTDNADRLRDRRHPSVRGSHLPQCVARPVRSSEFRFLPCVGRNG